MKLKNLCLAVGIAVLSVPALASTDWSNGTFQGNLDIGGTITPSNYTQNWRWKTGDALTGLNKKISEMTDDFRKLTVTFSGKTAILLGDTAEALRTYNGLSGLTPQISFSDASGNKVTLQQTATSKGYLTLPVVKSNDDQKIGSLKLNVTSVAMYVKPSATHYVNAGVQVRNPGDVFYGGLFPSSVSAGVTNGVNNMLSGLGVKSANELKAVLRNAPGFVTPSTGNWRTGISEAISLGTSNDLYSFAYGMYIDNGQQLEATFDDPVSSTTNWKSKLNVSITYL